MEKKTQQNYLFFSVDIVISPILSLSLDSSLTHIMLLKLTVWEMKWPMFSIVTFVTDPCTVIKYDECAVAKPYHINPVFLLLFFSHSRGRMLHFNFDCISFCDDMPARIIAAYSLEATAMNSVLLSSFCEIFIIPPLSHTRFEFRTIWNEKRLFLSPFGFFLLFWCRLNKRLLGCLQSNTQRYTSQRYNPYVSVRTVHQIPHRWCISMVYIKWADLIWKMTASEIIWGKTLRVRRGEPNSYSKKVNSKCGDEPYGNSHAYKNNRMTLISFWVCKDVKSKQKASFDKI